MVDFGRNFTPMISIEDYTSFFLSIILGLGISFEMPILIFFLALFGIVSPKFLWKNIRYAILAVFLVAAVICPALTRGRCASTRFQCWGFTGGDRCGVAGSSIAPEGEGGCFVMFSFWTRAMIGALLMLPLCAQTQQRFNGGRAYEYAKDFVAIGPRWPTGPGHAKAEALLRAHFEHDQLEQERLRPTRPSAQ